jgi:hypothetical protein
VRLDWLRAEVDALSRISVIVITAVDQLESVVRCIKVGATDYPPTHLVGDVGATAAVGWRSLASRAASGRRTGRASLHPRDACDAGPGPASFAMSTQASSPSSAAWSAPVSAVASAGAVSEDLAATNVRSASSP